jgi:hypothetical protein
VLDDLAGDVEAEAGTAYTVRGRGISLRELAEHTAAELQRNTGTVIGLAAVPVLGVAGIICPAWKKAMAVANAAYADMHDPIVPGPLFYHATRVEPGWARSRTAVATIGNHVFYR